MTAPLTLDSLEISNFRAFDRLHVDHLARVNLIVGKNNVGKTSLLEALQIYANRGSIQTIVDILEFREESFRRRVIPRVNEDSDGFEFAIKSLFHGRERGGDKPFQIGSSNAGNGKLSAELKWYRQQVDDQGLGRLVPIGPTLFDDLDVKGDEVLALTIQVGNQPEAIYRLDRAFDRRIERSYPPDRIKLVFVRANGLSANDIGALWDNTTLTRGEDDVLRALRIIDERVQRVNMVGNPLRERERIVQASLNQEESRIPLRSLGEGMNRLFGISLALVNSRDGMLLIDEIDTGLHYTILPKMWQLVLEIANRLQVQVFATTHSWDCIQAFQEALSKQQIVEGQVVSLRKKNDLEGEVVAVLWDRRRLGIATRDDIEVR